MRAAYDLAPVIADVISAHCRGTSARQTFMRACILGDWPEARSMVEGMLAEPGLLRGTRRRVCANSWSYCPALRTGAAAPMYARHLPGRGDHIALVLVD